MASDFDFDLPLNQYFLSEVAEHLESKGINCLDDLIDAMYLDPERWATRLDLSKEGATESFLGFIQKNSAERRLTFHRF